MVNRPRDVRRLWPLMLGVVLLLLAGIVISRIPGQRAAIYNQTVTTLEDQLNDAVASWEEDLLTRIGLWAETARNDPSEARTHQSRFRRQHAWFDALYLWVPRKEMRIDGRRATKDAYLLYPRPPSIEDTGSLLTHPCLVTARMVSSDSGATPRRMARALLSWCGKEALPVRVIAASEAASVLNTAGKHGEALASLSVKGLPADLSLVRGQDLGVAPQRMVIHRNQVAGTMAHLGRVDEAMALYYETGLQITGLDGPEAHQQLVQAVHWPILRELDKHGYDNEAKHLRARLAQLKRRVHGFKEVAERALPIEPKSVPRGPQFIFDQYSDPPFLLFYEVFAEEQIGVALQLDQPTLLTDFLATMRRLRKELIIEDSQAGWVGGKRTDESLAISVPFSRTLTHLRVGFPQSSIQSRVRPADEQWLVPLILTLLCVVFGFLSITAQLRASKQQQLLLVRQREFTTRVTHELKTPLAGIRVMAENLELGAWRTEEQAKNMASSIIQEADRLTRRVDEILTVGREPVLPQQRPVDVESAILEAVEVWGPRLERGGIRLEAELDVTDEVLGNANALRDVIGCLLDNALKYHDETKGTPQVWVTLVQKSSWVIIDVSDNGIGIPKHHRDQIFDRFVRVEGPNRGKAGGHGLGLAQVAAVVAQHNGKVVCGEGVDGGARFTIRLPAIS
jgi:signal transduction histidine kinase